MAKEHGSVQLVRCREMIGRQVDHLTRLVALTGYGRENDKTVSPEAGFDAHLVKPVDFVKLVETIESLGEPKPVTR